MATRSGRDCLTAVGAVEPSLFKAFNPWDVITTPESLAGLFSRAGVPSPAVTAVRTDVVFAAADRPR